MEHKTSRGGEESLRQRCLPLCSDPEAYSRGKEADLNVAGTHS